MLVCVFVCARARACVHNTIWYSTTLWKQLVIKGLEKLFARSQFQSKPYHCETCQRSLKIFQDISV